MAAGSSAAVIGPSVKLRGELSGTEDLEFNGEVKGSINLIGARLTIGANGKVVGDISAREVIVLGNVEGNIDAVERADFRDSSVVTGKISAARLHIEPGADLHVKVTPTDAKAEAAAAVSTAAPEESKTENMNLFSANHGASEADAGTAKQAEPAKPRTESKN